MSTDLGTATLLQDGSGPSTEEQQVELRKGDPDVLRERPPSALDLEIPAGRQGPGHGPHDPVAGEVPEHVAVQDCKAVREPDVPQEMGRLLHREPVDLAD